MNNTFIKIKRQAYDNEGRKIPYAIYEGDYVVEEIETTLTDISYYHNQKDYL